jgi:hypothetical protein
MRERPVEEVTVLWAPGRVKERSRFQGVATGRSRRSRAAFRRASRPALCRRRFSSSLGRHPFWKLFASRLAIPLLEGLVGNFSFHEELCELASLRLALERHVTSRRRHCTAVASLQSVQPNRSAASPGRSLSASGDGDQARPCAASSGLAAGDVVPEQGTERQITES